MASNLRVDQILPSVGTNVAIGTATGTVTLAGTTSGTFSGNLTGTASTATAAATAYGISGSPTLSGITSVSTTNLTVNGNAYPSAGSLSNRNVIINGAMEIAQRGTSALTVSGSYPVDRFYISHNSDGAFSTVRDSESPNGFTYSTKVTTTTADASLTGSQRLLFVQTLEGQNVSFLDFGSASAKSITLSFWVRSSVIGTFSGSIANGVANRAYPFDYNISSADTWEYKTITIPGDTTGTWATDNSTGMQLIFSLGIASGYAGTAGAWVGSQLWGSTSGTANILGTLNATWYITGVQLEVGSVATPFEHRSYGDELARCQRYYQVITGWGFVIASSSTTEVRTGIRYSPPMRDVPSFSLSKALKLNSPGSSETSQSSAAVSITGQSGSSTQYGAILSFSNFSGLTSQQAYLAPWDNTQLFASAEL